MIFYWLRKLWLRFCWLVTPPTARDVARIDPSTPCPVCGNRDGRLTCVHAGNQVVCQHTCNCCGARFFEKPVAAVTTDQVWKADDVLSYSSDVKEISTSSSRSGRAA